MKHKDIDKTKWQNMASNDGALLYVNAWYLDIFCVWDAIVVGDYEAGMPLPIIKKWLIKKIYQPPFVQMCQWIGTMPNYAQLHQINKLLRKQSFFIHFNTNLLIDNDVHMKFRTNFVRSLEDDYDNIYGSYSKSLKKNLRRAVENGLRTEINLEAKQKLVSFYKKAFGALNPHLKKRDYDCFLQMLLFVEKEKNLILIEVLKERSTLAVLCFVKHRNRIYYLLGAPNEEGRLHNAISAGIDFVLKENAGTALIFDFEGSSIPSVAAFFSSFSPQKEEFYEITKTIL